MNEILKNIINYLNDNYNQASENYNFILGAKPEVIKYANNIAISFWACGAIVCIDHLLYFISEDDGYWFLEENPCFSIGWLPSYSEALDRLQKYVNNNGKPVYYKDTDVLCHYTLED